ncbi:MAG: T9SS type A sorting domain-containing protein [Lentimicrobium sp.]
MKKTITILSILFAVCFQNSSYAAVKTSAQSGFFSEGSTWAGGSAPAPYDDIIIASGHTVTLDVAPIVFNITIQNGATLDNTTYSLTIGRSSPGNPIYNNNGTHNGTGYLIAYDDYKTELSGNGITNCTIIIRSYGLSLLNDCQLTINGNIQHASPGNNGMNGKILIEAWQAGATLTVNGNIVTNSVDGGVGIENGANIIVNGNVSLPGSSSNGTGGIITNFAGGTFNISGNLSLGPYSSYCQNLGSMVIGGDLTGGYDTYFFQEVNAVVKFGGSVFPDGDGFLFAVESPIYGSSQPNTIEYNGTSTQNIPLPTDMAYSNLVISNTNATAEIATDLTVYIDLTIKPGSALTVGTGGSLSVSGTITLESDATGTGSFITDEATSADIQRYIAEHNGNTNDGWHLLSSPVSAQAIGDFHTAGSGDDFYKWDEPANLWINRTSEGGGLNGSFETNFAVGKGYLTANATTSTKTFTGSINTSNVNITNLSYTGANDYAGWHLLGNPFSSALIWNNGNWALNNVDANAQVWNEANASYTVIAANASIPASNGFMVHVGVNNASLTIPASARTHDATNWYKTTEQTDRIVLTAVDAEGGTAQSSIIRFDANATNGYDSHYDCYFLPGFAPNLYSVTQNEKFALNTLPELTGGLTIPIGFQKNGSSRFSIELTENIPGQAVYLTDLTNSVTTNLAEGSYSFDAREGDDANRFLLHFSTLGIDKPLAHQSLSAWVYDKVLYLQSDEPGNLHIYDLQGCLLRNYRIDTSDLQNLPVNLPSGVYVIRLQGKSEARSVKIVVQ